MGQVNTSDSILVRSIRRDKDSVSVRLTMVTDLILIRIDYMGSILNGICWMRHGFATNSILGGSIRWGKDSGSILVGFNFVGQGLTIVRELTLVEIGSMGQGFTTNSILVGTSIWTRSSSGSIQWLEEMDSILI